VTTHLIARLFVLEKTMLSLYKISKSYKDKVVLKDVTLSPKPGEVIALIGANGAGKTTLLKILLGEVKSDEGQITNHHDVVGYIPQELDNLNSTIEESFGSVEPWRIDYALSLVGLDSISKDGFLGNLSGGQKTRVTVAQVLAQDPEPTVLLLDEPTNNLDAEGLDWLEDFVKRFKGAILFVSHDRRFINAVATKVVELKDGATKQYGGSYDFYKEQKDIELQAALEKYEKQQEEKKRLKKAMVAQKEATKHVHEHIKRADNDKYQRDFFRNRASVKLGQKAKNIETRLDKLEEVERPDFSKGYGLSLGGSVHNSKLLVRVESVSKSYEANTPLSGINLEIRGGSHIHLKGLNGSGKSTLLRLIAKRIEPSSGNIIYGSDVTVGYFSQDTEGLDYTKSAIDNLSIYETNQEAVYRQARSLGIDAGSLQKMPAELSRGQQSKLAFAKLLLANHDLLILDEPTNHLDISTKEQLENALQNYAGAILVASHDAYFLQQLKIERILNLVDGRIIES
jgi:ATPase subunit of ABC transporter with duplicated ATPase domains